MHTATWLKLLGRFQNEDKFLLRSEIWQDTKRDEVKKCETKSEKEKENLHKFDDTNGRRRRLYDYELRTSV